MKPFALILVGDTWHLVHVSLLRLDRDADPVPHWTNERAEIICPVGNEDRVWSLSEITGS